jgi:hypothetical protein
VSGRRRREGVIRVPRLVHLVSLAALVAVAQATAAHAADTSPHVTFQPAVVRLQQHATIAVTDFRTPGLEVRVVGATYPDGTLIP